MYRCGWAIIPPNICMPELTLTMPGYEAANGAVIEPEGTAKQKLGTSALQRVGGAGVRGRV